MLFISDAVVLIYIINAYLLNCEIFNDLENRYIGCLRIWYWELV